MGRPRVRSAAIVGEVLRLGPGEHADALTIARYGRALFLARLPDEVLRGLMKTCAMPYRECPAKRVSEWYDLIDPDGDDLDEACIGAKARREAAERTRPLREALLAWADRWPPRPIRLPRPLRQPWAMDAALFTLRWHTIGAKPRCLIQPIGEIRGTPWWNPSHTDDENRASFARWGAWKRLHHPEPIPGIWPNETDAEFRHRVGELMEKQIQTRAEIERAAGMEPTPELRPRRHEDRGLLPADRRVEWTVRYRVEGEALRRIAASESVTVSAVRKAVREFADQIGLLRKFSDQMVVS